MAMSNNTGINGPNWIAPTSYISNSTIPWHNTSPTPIDVNNISAHPVGIIQGEMFAVSLIIPETMAENVYEPDEIKEILIKRLIEDLCVHPTNKYIEFTKVMDPVSYDHTFRARIFIVPDTQVRLLRLNGYDTVAK